MIHPSRGSDAYISVINHAYVGGNSKWTLSNPYFSPIKTGCSRIFSLSEKIVRHILSDMKTLTMRDLNRNTASVLDALELGETFELHRNGKAIGYLTHTAPPPERKPDWKAHLEWLKKQPKGRGKSLLAEFEQDRRRLRAREKSMGNQS